RQHFERFRGDGICVSTPTGSTGYSKSIGGAVLHPGLKALQMTEIASLNNRVYRTLSSPLIIAEDEVINLDLLESQDLLLTLDHITTTETEVKNIRLRIAKDSIRFARYRHTHFWDRVSDAFIGEKLYMTVKWQVTVEDEKQLKEFLKQKRVSRRIIGRMKIHGGSFLVNGQEERVRKELKVGDWVELNLPIEEPNPNLVATHEPLDILYEDDHYLIVNKPVGLISVPSSAHRGDTVASRVKGYY